MTSAPVSGVAGQVPGNAPVSGFAGYVPGNSPVSGFAGSVPGNAPVSGGAGSMPGNAPVSGLAGQIPGNAPVSGIASAPVSGVSSAPVSGVAAPGSGTAGPGAVPASGFAGQGSAPGAGFAGQGSAPSTSFTGQGSGFGGPGPDGGFRAADPRRAEQSGDVGAAQGYEHDSEERTRPLDLRRTGQPTRPAPARPVDPAAPAPGDEPTRPLDPRRADLGASGLHEQAYTPSFDPRRAGPAETAPREQVAGPAVPDERTHRRVDLGNQGPHGNLPPEDRTQAIDPRRAGSVVPPAEATAPVTGAPVSGPSFTPANAPVSGPSFSPADAPVTGLPFAEAVEPVTGVPFAEASAPVTGAPGSALPVAEPESGEGPRGLGWLLSMSGLGAETPVPDTSPLAVPETVVPEEIPVPPAGWFAQPVDEDDTDAEATEAETSEAQAGSGTADGSTTEPAPGSASTAETPLGSASTAETATGVTSFDAPAAVGPVTGATTVVADIETAAVAAEAPAGWTTGESHSHARMDDDQELLTGIDQQALDTGVAEDARDGAAEPRLGRHEQDTLGEQAGRHEQDTLGEQTGRHEQDTLGEQTGRHEQDTFGERAGRHERAAAFSGAVGGDSELGASPAADEPAGARADLGRIAPVSGAALPVGFVADETLPVAAVAGWENPASTAVAGWAEPASATVSGRDDSGTGAVQAADVDGEHVVTVSIDRSLVAGDDLEADIDHEAVSAAEHGGSAAGRTTDTAGHAAPAVAESAADEATAAPGTEGWKPTAGDEFASPTVAMPLIVARAAATAEAGATAGTDTAEAVGDGLAQAGPAGEGVRDGGVSAGAVSAGAGPASGDADDTSAPGSTAAHHHSETVPVRTLTDDTAAETSAAVPTIVDATVAGGTDSASAAIDDDAPTAGTGHEAAEIAVAAAAAPIVTPGHPATAEAAQTATEPAPERTDVRTEKIEAAPGHADIRTGKAEAVAGHADTRAGKADVRTGKILEGEADAAPIRQRRDQHAPADRRRADPEEILAAYPWMFDPQTLREQVADPERLGDLADRLSDRLEFAERDNVRAGLLSLRAVVSRVLGELDDALADGREALRHAEASGEARTVSVAQTRLAHVLQWRTEFDEADRLYAQADSPELPARTRAEIREMAGRSAFEQGRFLEAVNHFERALDLCQNRDPELVERIELALDVISRRSGEGWGPYPRSRDEVLGLPAAPTPLTDDGTGLWGYAAAVEPRYAQAQPFAEGVAWVRRPESPAWELIDPSGTVLIGADSGYLAADRFAEGLAWVTRDAEGGWSAIDRANRLVVPGGFEDVRPFRRGLALFRRAGGWGAVDRHGRIVVQPKYRQFATVLSAGGPIDGFSDEGLAVVEAEAGAGVVDRTGQPVVPPVHKAVVLHPSAFLIADEAGRWGALDRQGEPLVETRYVERADAIEQVELLRPEVRPVL
ncbi:WG repeat-containing protein [Actinoplanes awajinensis]|uniref:Uncharacterized protein n=1 Tax=Actinoplanes awajinensis subsp. mycoplanecinus TaxID=135947 RepID=A0A124G865_9ACTN|nr:WG repeat-containing protein [Actinoplanes awajinensis]KUL25000.1 hypothetical protein ADL15_42820 [Actinoplanes awajinensis subsp. mycoplanecinus]